MRKDIWHVNIRKHCSNKLRLYRPKFNILTFLDRAIFRLRAREAMSVNRTTSSPPAATAAAEFPPAEVHQKPPTPPPPTDDAQAIPHTSFFHRQSSSRSSSGGGRSSSAVVPADDYGIVAYELDPWDRGDGDDGEGGEEEKEEAMLHAGWIRKAEEEVCEKRQWRQRDIQALREMVQGEGVKTPDADF